MPPSRLPRHAAAETSRRRAVLPPAVLLSAAAIAFGGLAVMPAETSTVRLTAASASSPIVLGAAPSRAQLDSLYGIAAPPAAKKAAPARPAARASRGNRTPVAAKPATPKLTWVRPVTGRLTSAYKWRWGRMHTGIDIAAPYGTTVRAVAAGRVISSGWSGAYGKLIKIEHADGTITYYAHNSQLLVSGGWVAAGEAIARVGSTGRSTGPHVHFEVRPGGGGASNPIPWLAKRGIFF